MKTKTITITDKHEKWIIDKSINLSRFVQKKLDEEENKKKET